MRKSQSRVNSRQELMDYALRSLGAPMLKINVDPEQLEDRIDDALDMFWEYHMDGSQRALIKMQITQEHLLTEQIMLPDEVLSVLRVFPLAGGGVNPYTNLQYQMYITDIMDVRWFSSGTGPAAYTTNVEYLSTLNNIFSPGSVVSFHVRKNYLTMETDWKRYKVGDWILIEGYIKLDPEEFPEMWNSRWLKDYVTALFKRQWGSNLTKFSGAQLSGGVSINGDKILDDAVNEIRELEEKLKNDYQLPVDFFVG